MGSRPLAKRAEITLTELPFACNVWSLVFFAYQCCRTYCLSLRSATEGAHDYLLWSRPWEFEMDIIHRSHSDWGHFIWKQLRGKKHIITKEWEERSGNTRRLDHSLKMDTVFTVGKYNKSKTWITPGQQTGLWIADFLMQSKRKQLRLMVNVKFRSRIEQNITYFMCVQNGIWT